MLERGAKFLELVYDSPRWRIWEVRDTGAAGLGRREAARRRAELVHGRTRPSRRSSRYRYTPYWSTSDDACVSRAPGGWTRVEPDAAGRVLVQARFGLERSRRAKRAARPRRQLLSAGPAYH